MFEWFVWLCHSNLAASQSQRHCGGSFGCLMRVLDRVNVYMYIYIYICTMYTNIYMYYVYMYICTMYIYTHTWNTLATKVTFSISTDAEIGFLNLTSKALQCTGLNFSGRFQGADWEPEGWLGFWRVTHPTWWVMRLFYMFRVKIPVMISVTSKFLKSNKNGQTSRKNRYNVWDDRGFWYLALD